MHEAICQYLPELISAVKEVTVAYIIYRVTKGTPSTPCSKAPEPRRFYLFRNLVKPLRKA